MESEMRIAIFAIYVRGADSIGRQLIEWVRALHRHGHTVRVIVERVDSGAPADVLAYTVVHTEGGLRHSDDWEYVRTADLVICDYPAFYGLADCLRLLDRPAILFHYRGVTPPALWPDPAGRAFLEQSRRRASLVHFTDLAVSDSEFTRQELHHLTGYPLDRIRVLPCVVPPPPPMEPCPPASDTTPLILSVGRLAANKRPHLLVEALAQVRREVPGTRLVLVGDTRGPSHAPVLAKVRAYAEELGLTEAVFCTGLVDDLLLEHLYAQASVLVSASAHEGFCIPVAEAMARGVPVVCMDAGALPETVGDAGILVPDGDVPMLAAAIIRVLRDTAERRDLITRGLMHAGHYRPEAVIPRILQLIERLGPHTATQTGLARLGQMVDLGSIEAAAEVAPALLEANKRIPLVSTLATRLRRWMSSETRRTLDELLSRQVTYNRQVARALHALDELSAQLSEREAALRLVQQAARQDYDGPVEAQPYTESRTP